MRAKSLLFAAFVLLGTLAVFWLPTKVAMPDSGSISYIFGFNNHVALLSLLAVMAIGCFAMRGVDVEPPLEEDRSLPRSTLWWGIAATLAGCAVMYAITRRSGGFDESPYLITRIRLMQTGLRPYLDFEFLYGPLVLYPAYWACKLFRIDAADGYYLAWTALWVLGTVMQYWIIQWLGFPARYRKKAFWLFFSVYLSYMVSTGIPYSTARQLGVLFSILAMHRLVMSGRRWLGFGMAVVMLAGLFGLSPEIGFAFIATAAVYFAAAAEWRKPTYWLGYAMMLAGFAIVSRLAIHFHEMDSFKGFASGGSDIPLILTPTVALVFACLFIAGCYGVARLWAGDLRDARVPAVVVSFGLLPGALGRCDPSHVVAYEIGALLVTLLLAARHPRTWRWFAPVFFLLTAGFLLGTKLWIDTPFEYSDVVRDVFPSGQPDGPFSRLVAAQVEKHFGRPALNKMLHRIASSPRDAHQVFPDASPVLQAPLGYYAGGNASVLQPDIVRGYYEGFTNMMGPKQLQRKIDELKDHPERDLLLPWAFDPATSCDGDASGGERLLKQNFGYTYFHRQKNKPKMVLPFCQYIQENYYLYKPAPADRSVYVYSLWRRKP